MTKIFTQKHFIAVAALLQEIRPVKNVNSYSPGIANVEYLVLAHQWDKTVKSFVACFKKQNSKFNTARFIEASGGLINE